MVRGSAALTKLSRGVDQLNVEDLKTRIAGFAHRLKKPNHTAPEAYVFQRRSLASSAPFIPVEAFQDARPHGLSPSLCDAWSKAVAPIVRLYKQAADIALTRSPHRVAYEGALSTLFREELERITVIGGERVRDPQRAALEFARSRVGASPPTADQRCEVAAIWTTLELRIALVEVAQTLLKTLETTRSTDDNKLLPYNIDRLRHLISFIAQSAHRDADRTLAIALDSHAERLILQAHLHVLRCLFELSRLDTNFAIAQDSANRVPAADESEARRRAAMSAFDEAITSFGSQSDLSQEWLAAKYVSPRPPQKPELTRSPPRRILPAKAILDKQWTDLIRRARAATFYAPVTEDEKRVIIAAMRSDLGVWGPRGHWFVLLFFSQLDCR